MLHFFCGGWALCRRGRRPVLCLCTKLQKIWALFGMWKRGCESAYKLLLAMRADAEVRTNWRDLFCLYFLSRGKSNCRGATNDVQCRKDGVSMHKARFWQ